MSSTIIVIEDDDTLADNIREFLERQGHEAIACGTAEAALEMIRSIEPDLVLSDYNLPGMSGTDLVTRVREIDPQIKAVMMTGDDRVQTAVDAMKAGAFDYLTKPVALAELKLVVERALGTRRMETALAFHKDRQAKGAGLDAMIGTSPAIRDLKATIGQILDAEKRMVDGDLPQITSIRRVDPPAPAASGAGR